MPALLKNLAARWFMTSIAIFSLLACVLLDLSERRSQCWEDLRAERAIVARLEQQVSELESERTALESSRETERTVMKGWLERVAISREAALRIAMADAEEHHRGSKDALEIYGVEASLELDGWHVDFVFK